MFACIFESSRLPSLLMNLISSKPNDPLTNSPTWPRMALPPARDGNSCPPPYEHKVEKGRAFALGLLDVKMNNFRSGQLLHLGDWHRVHNQAGIAHNSGVEPLFMVLESETGSIQHNSAFALYGLADNEDILSNFIKVGGVKKLQQGEFGVQPTKDCVAKTLKRLEEKIDVGGLGRKQYKD